MGVGVCFWYFGNLVLMELFSLSGLTLVVLAMVVGDGVGVKRVVGGAGSVGVDSVGCIVGWFQCCCWC